MEKSKIILDDGGNQMFKKLRRSWYHRAKSILYKISEEAALRFTYFIVVGKKLDLKYPISFNEKIQWLKINWKSNLVVKCTDKYEVRKYVESKGLSEILNDLYFVYDDVDEIIWEELPNSFALKTNNGCKTMFITKNKNSLNELEVKNKMREWLQLDYGIVAIEPHYSQIKPKIICEKYIENNKGEFPIDYKFFCFNGEPLFLAVIDERNEENSYHRCFLDINWQVMDIEKVSAKNDLYNIPKKPETFDKMLECARILSADFPFVRVDLYEMDKKVLFGELTFTPVSGMATYFTTEAQLEIGNLINLPTPVKEY